MALGLGLLLVTPAHGAYPQDCLGMDAPSGTDCMDITYEGCCDAAGQLVWCDAGQLYCLPCPTNQDPAGQSCGWSAEAGFYDCGPSTEPEPTGTYPRDCESKPETCENGTCDEGEDCANCPEDCGCPEGQNCFNKACCTPSCDGKECGDDGCGGACGPCDIGMLCEVTTCVAPVEICTAAQAVSCDDVVAGDTTGGSMVFDAACGNWPTTGPEVVYSFVPAIDDRLILELTEGAEGLDHDLGLMANYCVYGACVAAGDDKIVMDVEAGRTYYIVVDGYQESAGPFTLNVRCRSTCTPQCEGKECGDDGCGGECGDTPCTGFCVEGLCYSEGGCMASSTAGCDGCDCEACVCEIDPFCCGAEGGTWDNYCQLYCLFDCGGCGVDETCGDGTCLGAENCVNCLDDCGCDDSTVCFEYECCAPDCDGKECGDNGCGGVCGGCDPGYICNAAQLCEECIPACDGKECGDDGCGGQCGECPEGESCQTGLCVGDSDEYPAACRGFSQPSAASCGDVDDLGCCDTLGRVVFCYQNALYCADCVGLGAPSCGWNAEYSYYDCGTDGSANPANAESIVCPEVVICVPDCTDKECGNNGCDGSCGTCDAGHHCQEGKCMLSCTPDCIGKQCGSDGCTGTCGTCDEGTTCQNSTCVAVVEPDVITEDTTVPQDVTEQDTTQPEPGTGGGGGSCSTHASSAGSTAAWMLALMMVLGLAWMRRFSLGR